MVARVPRKAATKRKPDRPAAKQAWPADKVERWEIGRLLPYANNPRLHSDAQVEQLRASFREFGWTVPVLVDEAGEIIAGHGRVMMAQKEGIGEIPTLVARGWTEAQKSAYRINDNQLVLLGSWDKQLLASELTELKTTDYDLSLTGFSANELVSFMAGGEVDQAAEEVPELLPEAVSRRGDLWTLGEHRLLCGDATVEADVRKLLGAAKAHLVYTDPPYGVDYDGGTKVRPKLEGDANTLLYGPACAMAAKFSDGKSSLYLWHAGVKGIAAAAAAAAAAAGYEIRCEIIWNKNHAQFGALSAQYKQKHEPLYYCFKRGHTARWFGPTNEITVWDCDRAASNDYHPTQKPAELARRALTNSSSAGDIVLDLFLGSGSTMIAAEMTERKCVGVEIDPSYVDVAVRRWEQFTGKKARLDGKQGFDAVAAARQKKAAA